MTNISHIVSAASPISVELGCSTSLTSANVVKERSEFSRAMMVSAAVCAFQVMAAGNPAMAQELPTDGHFVAGAGTITNATGRVDITQGTDRGVIDWKTFNIAKDNTVQFHQPSASSRTLNRVTEQDNASVIAGNLIANGHVTLVNPNGVFFTKDSQVDVNGLIASTSNITNEDFMAGKLNFDKAGNPNAKIVNQGTIKSHGLAALVAPSVVNDGVIEAGTVVLASGKGGFDPYGDKLLYLTGGDKTQVKNSGVIVADGGTVVMTAQAVSDVVDALVNQDGVIQASKVKISSNGDVNITGDITAPRIDVEGKNIKLASTAKLDASGEKAGGKIRVGGGKHGADTDIKNADNVTVEKGAKLTTGDKGEVIVWSDNTTRFDGIISAKGGFVETSGKTLEIGKDALVTAAEWLLDPTDITIDDALGTSTKNSLNLGTNITITTASANADAGDITVATNNLDWTGTGNLTLTADRDVKFNNNMVINSASSTAGTGNVVINGRNVSLGSGAKVNTNGGDIRVNNTGILTADANSFTRTSSDVGTVSVNQNAGGSIQGAMNAISNNVGSQNQVHVGAGTYDENLLIANRHSMQLFGEAGTTIIRPTAISANEFTRLDGVLVNPIVMVQNSDVKIENITVDGSLLADSAAGHTKTGFGFDNADAITSSLSAVNIKDGATGAHQASGVYAQAASKFDNNTVRTDGVRQVDVNGATFSNIGHAAVHYAGDRMTGQAGTSHGNIITMMDAGTTQYGVIAEKGANSRIHANTIDLTAAHDGSIGILIDNAGTGNTYSNIITGAGDTVGLRINNSDNQVVDKNIITQNELGIEILDSDNVTLTNNTVTNNGGGVYLDNSKAIFTNGTYSFNLDNSFGHGISIENGSVVTLNNVTARGNKLDGARAVNSNLTVNGGTFNDNFHGVGGSLATLVLNGIDASGNLDAGAEIQNSSATINNGTFNNNGGDGIHLTLSNGAQLNNVTASNNRRSGVFADLANNLQLTGGTFNNNTDDGLTLQNSAGLNLTGLTASGNGVNGVYFDNTGATNLTNGTFDANGTGVFADGDTILNLTNNNITNGARGLGLDHNAKANLNGTENRFAGQTTSYITLANGSQGGDDVLPNGLTGLDASNTRFDGVYGRDFTQAQLASVELNRTIDTPADGFAGASDSLALGDVFYAFFPATVASILNNDEQEQGRGVERAILSYYDLSATLGDTNSRSLVETKPFELGSLVQYDVSLLSAGQVNTAAGNPQDLTPEQLGQLGTAAGGGGGDACVAAFLNNPLTSGSACGTTPAI